MSSALDRLASIATIVVAVCATVVTGRYLVAARDGGATSRPETVRVPDWEKFLIGGQSTGPTNADLTVLEFGDYECPFCATFAKHIDAVLASHPGRVRFVYRHWPLAMHKYAYPAARAAECAGEQGRFWDYHSLLYAKHDSLGLLSFRDMAQRVAVADLDAFDRCERSTDPVPSLERAIADVKVVGGDGTPTLVVNGLLMNRPVDSTYLRTLLERNGGR